MLIASARSQNLRRASHQPAFMKRCLTIGHTRLTCLLNEGTLLFWNDLFVTGRMVSWERWDSAELGKWKSWQGSELGRWKRCVRVVRWEKRESSEVTYWKFAGYIQ